MPILEPVEWEDVWFFDVTDTKRRRVFLIGDSICFGYKTNVRLKLNEKNAITGSFATSKAIDNEFLTKKIGMLVEEMNPEIIHFNNCNHGFHIGTADYAYHYERTVNYLLSLRPADRIILATGTSMLQGNKNDEFVKPRNEIVLKLADKYGLALDDLFSVIPGESDTRCDDGVHFTEEGYELLGDRVVSEIVKKF